MLPGSRPFVDRHGLNRDPLPHTLQRKPPLLQRKLLPLLPPQPLPQAAAPALVSLLGALQLPTAPVLKSLMSS
jgi:hypothetical protein